MNKTSKTLSTKNKWLGAGFIVLSLLGFLDATYLTVEHYSGTIPPCSIAHGCEAVLTSSFSTVAGVPVSLLGALYYLVIFILAVTYLDTKNDQLLKRTAELTILGLLASLYFFVVQGFVLHAWCQYCLGSAASSTLLFIHGLCTHASLKKSS